MIGITVMISDAPKNAAKSGRPHFRNCQSPTSVAMAATSRTSPTTSTAAGMDAGTGLRVAAACCAKLTTSWATMSDLNAAR
jgi:hypothetical protein